MALLDNPVQCPFCTDTFQLTAGQLLFLAKSGDKTLTLNSPTCGALGQISVDAGFNLDGDAEGLAGSAGTAALMRRTNSRILWTLAVTTKIKDLQTTT